MSPDTMTSQTMTPAAGQAAQEQPVARRRVTGPIVAAVGGSESSAVLPAARYLATVTANDVLAVAAIEPLPLYFPAEAPLMVPPEYQSEVLEARRAELQKGVEQTAGARSGWRTNVLIGDAARVVTDVARAEGAPLIVMGVGRHRPIDRLLSRETTLRAIRHASCPVLAVGYAFDPPFHKVAIATDFSAASARAAEAVMPLLTDGAEVHLVHVWQPIGRVEQRWQVLDERYEQSLPEKFRRFRAVLKVPAGVTVKEEIRQGRTAERLLDFASAHHVDLIVAGRQGLNALARLVVGSTTSTLLRGANCSLLIAPEPSVQDLDRLQRVLSGAVEVSTPEAWAVLLDDFTRRNRDRVATVEVDDLDLGTQVIESGFGFQGASYDDRNEQVELMLSAKKDRMQHVTRTISGVESVAVGSDSQGRDMALRIRHGAGQTLLMFTTA
ncbi:MAG TPA: universal stress protein [Gemmatimonadaceae bacterium]|nr:universal stress protein [Gemmatimonadaceae bacterium]